MGKCTGISMGVYVTFAASFDAKGLAATGSGSRIGSAWVTDRLQGPDVRWITLPDTPWFGCSKGGWSWHVTIAAAKREREEEEAGRLQGTN